MVSPICQICRVICDASDIPIKEVDLKEKENALIRNKCGCVYHTHCLQSHVQTQLRLDSYPTCYTCHEWINIKKEPKNKAEFDKEEKEESHLFTILLPLIAYVMMSEGYFLK